MTDPIRVRHRVSGKIAEVPEHIANHFVLGKYLEKVGPDAKPFLPEMHRTSLPAEPTEDQIAVAVAAGTVTEDEAKELRKGLTASEIEADKNAAEARKELETKRVALQAEADAKDKK